MLSPHSSLREYIDSSDCSTIKSGLSPHSDSYLTSRPIVSFDGTHPFGTPKCPIGGDSVKSPNQPASFSTNRRFRVRIPNHGRCEWTKKGEGYLEQLEKIRSSSTQRTTFQDRRYLISFLCDKQGMNLVLKKNSHIVFVVSRPV